MVFHLLDGSAVLGRLIRSLEIIVVDEGGEPARYDIAIGSCPYGDCRLSPDFSPVSLDPIAKFLKIASPCLLGDIP